VPTLHLQADAKLVQARAEVLEFTQDASTHPAYHATATAINKPRRSVFTMKGLQPF
jgi:hypothetical protein